MAIIKTPAAVDSPYTTTNTAPTVLRASADGTTVLATAAAATTSTTTSTAADANANVSYYATGVEGIAGLANQGRVFDGANVYVTLDQQNFNTTNRIDNPAGSNGYVQFNNGGILGGSANLAFDGANLLTGGIKTDNYYYANGSPFSGGGGSNYSNANVVALLSAFGSNTLFTTGNVTGGNLLTGGVLEFSGGSKLRPLGANLDIFAGAGSYVNLITADESSYMGVGGAGGYVVTAGGTWNFNTNGNLTAPGNVSAVGNITGGNVKTGGLISATGNVVGNNIIGAAANIPSVVSQNLDVENISARGSAGVNIGAGGFNNLVVEQAQVLIQNVPLSVSGNIIGGNVNTGGLISATGNITSGNVNTGVITLTNGAVIKDNAGDSVAFGQSAGGTSQGNSAVALGQNAGATGQGTFAVAIGRNAGQTTQGGTAIAIGAAAGDTSQGNSAVAIGSSAGLSSQSANTVAIGTTAGSSTQGVDAVAIGNAAGSLTQGISAVAIGLQAGQTFQGNNAIAIGAGAGTTNQAANSIILNATGAGLNQPTANTFTVAPVRNDVANTAQVMFYNATSKEITYGNTISVAGNITGGNISAVGNVNSDTVTAVTLSAVGNIIANNAMVTQRVSGANLDITGTANVGNLSTTGTVSANGNVTTLSTFYAGNGATWQSQVAFANVLFVGAEVGEAYIQAAIVETGGNGSADWVSYSNNGNTDAGWIDMGITGNTFSDPDYEITDPNDGYILVEGTNVLGTPLGGNLILATGTTGLAHDIVFATGGFTHANIKARLVDTTGEFSVVGNIVANNLSGTNLVINSITSDDSTFVTVEDGLNVNGEISATGNITGNYLIGNGSQLTSVAVPSQTILPTIQIITATSRPAGLFGGGQGGANVTVSNTIPVTEYGVIITSGTVSQTYTTGALGSIPGTVSLTFSTGLNSTQYTLYAYVTSNAGTYYSDAVTGTSGICLLAGTQIALSDGTRKAIEDITYTDKLLSWDFDRGCYAETTALWIKRSETGSQYNLLTFSDGTTLRTFDQHRIFNKQAGAFTYPMAAATPIGTVTVNEHGQEITLVNKQVIEDTIEYYNVITDYHMNLFSDSVLTSCRFNNIYPIIDMKFVKDSRTLRTRDEFENVPDRFFDGLRLAEQTTDIETVEWYVDRLLRTEVLTHAELAI